MLLKAGGCVWTKRGPASTGGHRVCLGQYEALVVQRAVVNKPTAAKRSSIVPGINSHLRMEAALKHIISGSESPSVGMSIVILPNRPLLNTLWVRSPSWRDCTGAAWRPSWG